MMKKLTQPIRVIAMVSFVASMLVPAAHAATQWDCKCGHASGQQRKEKGEYEKSFSVSVPDSGQLNVRTPCDSSQITSRLEFTKNHVRLHVANPRGMVGNLTKTWEQVGQEAKSGSQVQEAAYRFYLKFDPDMGFSDQTVLLPNQDVHAVVFCMKPGEQAISGDKAKAISGNGVSLEKSDGALPAAQKPH